MKLEEFKTKDGIYIRAIDKNDVLLFSHCAGSDTCSADKFNEVTNLLHLHGVPCVEIVKHIDGKHETPEQSILKNSYVVSFSNGEKWSVPVRIIATHRARYYAIEFSNDLQTSLEKDTIPLFESDHYEIDEWAKNNMDWSDVEEHASCISTEFNYTEAWVDCACEIQ